VLIAIIVGGVVYIAAYFVSVPLIDRLFNSDVGTGSGATLILAVPALVAGLIAGLATGLAGGAISRAAGIVGGLIVGLLLLYVNYVLFPVSVDTNLSWQQQLVPLLGPVLLAIFGAWVGEIIASLVGDSLVTKLKRRQDAERILRLYR
jgi:hypothetical protein